MKHIRNYFRESVMPPEGEMCEIEDEMFPTGNKVEPQGKMSLEELVMLGAWRELSGEFELPRFV
jgi:hypothetical protein